MRKEASAMTEAAEGQEEARRRQLFRVLVWASVGSGAVSLAGFVVLGLFVPRFPTRYLISGAALFVLLSLICLWLGRRGHPSLAIVVLMLSLMATLLVGTFFVGGVNGPLGVVLVSLPLIAALLAGPRAGQYLTVSVALAYLVLTLLEGMGVLRPREMSGPASRIVGGITYLGTLAVMSFMVSRFLDMARRALRVAERRGQELDEVSRQAKRAAQAEREAREREARTAWQLRQAVGQYVAFLERVSAGEYGTRLNLERVAQGEGSGELRALGQYLNSTVETLVNALQDMQVIQRRYLAQAWESAIRAGRVRRGFRYHDQRVEPSDGAWLSSMAQAVRNRGVTVSEGGLALPITVGGQVIGALGVLREGEARWSDEDVALARSAVDQLAQTMESLRLLDETQRREVREQTIGRAIARMRETLDLETVLQTVAREMRETLDLAEAEVRVGTGPVPARLD